MVPLVLREPKTLIVPATLLLVPVDYEAVNGKETVTEILPEEASRNFVDVIHFNALAFVVIDFSSDCHVILFRHGVPENYVLSGLFEENLGQGGDITPHLLVNGCDGHHNSGE